jgi:CO/xanthine dehydrogenase Mo-binding subunit
MSVSRMRLLVLGLPVAAGGLVAAGLAAGWLNAAEPSPAAGKPGGAVLVQSPDQGKSVDKDDKAGEVDRSVRVDAPGTKVTVDKDSGKVAVTAPHTEVHVDPDKGRVKVRAPYVNLDIQW